MILVFMRQFFWPKYARMANEWEAQAMKIEWVCALVMVVALLGGCSEQKRSGTLADAVIRVQTTQPTPTGPVNVEHRYVEYDQMLLVISQRLAEIEKDVKKTLDVANKKAPVSGDAGIRQRLDEIDSKIADVRTVLNTAGRKIPIFGDVVEIISYLRPKLSVELDPNISYSDSRMSMTFNITNRGEHSVSIGDPQLTLSTECVRGEDAAAGKLSPDVDYALRWESGGSCAAPGQTIKRIADIDAPQDELEGRPLYYSLCIDAETDPEIVEVLSGLLLDSLDTDKLYSLSHASLTFAGQVRPYAFRQPD
jgi:hypothetical protein